MAKRAIFVDAENVFYTQKKSLNWFIDWKRLRDLLAKGHEIVEAQYFAIKPIFNDEDKTLRRKKFNRFLTSIGFYVQEKPVKQYGTEGSMRSKGNIDVEISTAILGTKDKWDEVVFIGGDSDFQPIFHTLRNLGKRVIIVSSSKSVSYELRNVSHEFIDFSVIKAQIERK